MLTKTYVSTVVRSLLALIALTGGIIASPALPSLYAQGTTGSIAGTVKDPSDAVLPGVAIRATNNETGISRTTVTGGRGEYRLPSLPSGNYTLEASLSGFQTDVRQGIQMSIGRDAVVDFALRVGDVAERITVTAEAPLIETTTATVSGLVSPEQMRDIPLNARSFLDLVPLQTGAVIASAGAQVSSHGYGQKISISGTRYSSNVFLLDGAVTNDFFNGAGSAAGTVAGVETVREFRVITNAFDAEYGRHTGGVISAITKSGNNSFHGSLFEFLRNDNLDAPRWEDNAFAKLINNVPITGVKPEFRRNQFGGTLGGPIVRDNTFFFGSFEGLREAQASTQVFVVPGDLPRNGIVPTAAGARTSVPVNASVRPYLNAYPRATVPCAGSVPAQCAGPDAPFDRADGSAQFAASSNRVTDQNFYTARIDHRFTDSDSIFGRVTVDDATRDTPLVSGFNTTEQTGTGSRFITAEQTHIYSPALLGATHFSFSRTHNTAYDRGIEGFEFPLFTFGGAPDVPGRITIGGGYAGWGGNNFNPKDFVQNLFQFKEDFHLTAGRHSAKMGFYFERIQYNMRSDVNAGGTFAFANLTSFLNRQVNTATFIQPGSDNIRGWRENLSALYLQDDFTIRPGLTVNVGVRYEFINVPTEVNGKTATIRDLTPAHLYTVQPHQTDVGDPYFLNPSLRNFAPRVGLAWSPFAGGKTSIRSGFGVFHEQILPSYFVLPGVRSAPFYSVTGLSQNDVVIDFPNSYQSQVSQGTIGASRPQIDGWEYYISQPAVYKWNLDIQQQLGASTTFSAGYAASRGTHIMRGSLFLNTTPTTEIGGRQFVLIQQNIPNQAWDRMRFPAFDAASNYHSLQMKFDQKVGQRLQIHAAHTYSKATDEGSTIQGGADFGVADRTAYRRTKERGLAAYDVRHSFYTNFIYDLPGENLSGPSKHLLSGWGLAGLLRLNSGYPMNVSAATPTTAAVAATPGSPAIAARAYQFVNGSTVSLKAGGNTNPISKQNPDQYFDVSQFEYPEVCVAVSCSPQGGYFGNLGRSTMISPGIANVDFTLTKDTSLASLGEAGKLQFRAEFFNVLNRPNFSTPGLGLFTFTAPSAANVNGAAVRVATAGRITSTALNARQIQFALKLLF